MQSVANMQTNSLLMPKLTVGKKKTEKPDMEEIFGWSQSLQKCTSYEMTEVKNKIECWETYEAYQSLQLNLL